MKYNPNHHLKKINILYGREELERTVAEIATKLYLYSLKISGQFIKLTQESCCFYLNLAC